jgi:PTS system fructose-specific IIC component
MLIVPLCTGITLVIVMQYLINPIFGALNQAMVAFLLPPENPGAALLLMIAAGTAFDLGGPINKAAGSVALGLNGVSDTFDLTARELAIVIPSIGVGIAALLNNRFGLPDVFNNEEKTIGEYLTTAGIHWHFRRRDPLHSEKPASDPRLYGRRNVWRIHRHNVRCQAILTATVWGWPLATNVTGYLVSVFAGSLVCALGVLFFSPKLATNGESK